MGPIRTQLEHAEVRLKQAQARCQKARQVYLEYKKIRGMGTEEEYQKAYQIAGTQSVSKSPPPYLDKHQRADRWWQMVEQRVFYAQQFVKMTETRQAFNRYARAKYQWLAADKEVKRLEKLLEEQKQSGGKPPTSEDDGPGPTGPKPPPPPPPRKKPPEETKKPTTRRKGQLTPDKRKEAAEKVRKDLHDKLKKAWDKQEQKKKKKQKGKPGGEGKEDAEPDEDAKGPQDKTPEEMLDDEYKEAMDDLKKDKTEQNVVRVVVILETKAGGRAGDPYTQEWRQKEKAAWALCNEAVDRWIEESIKTLEEYRSRDGVTGLVGDVEQKMLFGGAMSIDEDLPHAKKAAVDALEDIQRQRVESRKVHGLWAREKADRDAELEARMKSEPEYEEWKRMRQLWEAQHFLFFRQRQKMMKGK